MNLDARYKRNDVVYLREDHGKELRKKYKIVEYYLGDIPDEKSQGHVKKIEGKEFSDHNYLIESIEGGTQRTVNESEIED
jgi:hypothetical protein